MIYRYVPLIALLVYSVPPSTRLFAQETAQDPVLFTVGPEKVHLSEFTYVYEKSNGESADYSQQSVGDFLELYQKFKLKVTEARNQHLDEDPALEAELAVYRDQLADKYMSDEAMLGRLTKELYDRMKWRVDVSHILRSLPPNANEVLIDRAIKDLEEAKKQLESGADFASVARKFSQDRSVMQNNGHLGYRRAKLPDGFYDLETAIYNTPNGGIAGPVHSRLGYHLVKVNGRVPDPGTIEIAHILIRTPRNGSVDTTQQEIERLYQMLKDGADFGELAMKYSQDDNNKLQKGYLGSFKSGKYTPEFEKAAFAIPEDGGFSKPVKTEYGWHIIQRISLDTLGSYESEKRHLEELVRNDSRYDLAQEALIERIRKEEHFSRSDVTNEELLAILTKDVFQVNWEVPEPVENKDLFTISDQTYDLHGFLQYLSEHLDARYQGHMVRDPAATVGDILDNYVNHELLAYEKAHLEEKYPEFREIMREYREGIMLFEISKEKIWDRAGKDTAGLRDFYERHRDDYHTPRTVDYDVFKVNTMNPKTLKKVERLIRKKSPGKVLKKLNKAAEVVTHKKQSVLEDVFEERFEVSDDELVNGKLYSISDVESAVTTYGRVNSISEAKPLSFEESRGTVMSDYQRYLEEQWVTQLQDKYAVEINEQVLQSIIKS